MTIFEALTVMQLVYLDPVMASTVIERIHENNFT